MEKSSRGEKQNGKQEINKRKKKRERESKGERSYY